MFLLANDLVKASRLSSLATIMLGLKHRNISENESGEPFAKAASCFGAFDYKTMKRSIFPQLLSFLFAQMALSEETPQEISVEQPNGTSLVSAEAVIDFGYVAVGTTSAPKFFTIANTGGLDLEGLSVTISGPAAGDFVIDATSLPTTLERGASAEFQVSYVARFRGAGEATLQIASNDADENPFTITLLGKGALPGNDDTIMDGAFNIEFVTVGSPGNAPDDTGYGAVGYGYRISKYEVSRQMVTIYNSLSGGPQITMSSLSEQHFPATGVSWNEAARFVNWLNTSCGYSPAYKLTTAGANDNIEPWTAADGIAYDPANPFRNPQAYYFLPSENEWYKAAYFDPAANEGSGAYWDYATGSNTAPVAVSRSLASGRAVYNGQAAPALITYAGGLSPQGTMAQNGNAEEWCESLHSPPYDSPGQSRVVRGGGWASAASKLASADRAGTGTMSELLTCGFRVASRLSPEAPPVSPITPASLLLDGYGNNRNFLAGNYTFYNAYNNPLESWQLSNGRLHVYPGGKKTAGYMWNAGHKLSSPGDSVSIQVFENTDGAIGLQFDNDLIGPDGGAGVRYYKAGPAPDRYIFGPWGTSMPLAGAPTGALLLQVQVLRVREACMDLRAKITGTGFSAIQRDFTMPSKELYFGIHAYSSYTSNSYYNICDNLSFSSPSPYWKWSQFHGLVPGVNDAAGDDPNGDGVVNAVSFAFDGSPFVAGMSSGKTRSSIHGTGEERFLTLTMPVRSGATFSGASPLVSSWVDGIRYELQGATELSGPWDLGILQAGMADPAGLPALRDITGDGIPEWEYRTFRLAQPVGDNSRAFMRTAIQSR